MGSIVVRKLDDRLKAKLRARAAAAGHSMEEEVRLILRRELEGEEELNLADLARQLFGPEHGVDLELPERGRLRDPPDFSG